MTNTLYIITGTNRGLGAAVFALLQQAKMHVLSITRMNHYNEKQDNIDFINQDLSERISDKTKDKLESIVKKYKNVVFVNNASIINPIGNVAKFDTQSIIDIYTINSIAPAILVSSILANTQNLTILNVSSGAAKRPIIGWSLYCATKAANEMFFNTIASEKIKIINFNPGVIDTKMQQLIRNCSIDEMPDVAKFQQLDKEKKLQNPEDVAKKIIKLIV